MTKHRPGGGRGRALTPEQAPDFAHPDRKRLAVLWARVEFLDNRIAEHGGSYDIQEVVALRWALELIGAPAPARKGSGIG